MFPITHVKIKRRHATRMRALYPTPSAPPCPRPTQLPPNFAPPHPTPPHPTHPKLTGVCRIRVEVEVVVAVEVLERQAYHVLLAERESEEQDNRQRRGRHPRHARGQSTACRAWQPRAPP